MLCSVAAFSNMALHDLDLPYRLPSLLSARSPVIDPYLVFDNRLNPTPHAYGVDLHYTWLQLVGITANTTAVFVLACATYRLAWQGRIGSEPANG